MLPTVRIKYEFISCMYLLSKTLFDFYIIEFKIKYFELKINWLLLNNDGYKTKAYWNIFL